MLTFQEIFDRALLGRISTEHDFDLKHFIPTVKKTGIEVWNKIRSKSNYSLGR